MSADVATRAEVCAVAVAECFRGDGTCLANPIGTIPMIGGRLARASFEPDLLMTDGFAMLIANDEATPAPEARVIESWNPYRRMFDVVWSGRRHVMMGATQVDR
ncbi:MAG: CoA-transferase, partial [Acidimicrobiia bacterium]|nr:CoA-transferase [Acidimicrobiia bacterium]